MVIERKYSSLTLPWTPDWGDIFGSDGPICVEIGFGNGDYLVHLAQSLPGHRVIGFEISNKSMEKAESRIKRHSLNNALAVHSRGETALHHLFEPRSIEQLHINYPDPWFKSRHAGRRIMQRDTLDAIVSRLMPGGMFYLATDIREYAEMSHELLRNTPELDNQLDTPWVHDLPGRYRTKYEQKGYAEGRPGHYFVYRRNDQPGHDIPVQKEYDMPHLILETPMPPEDIIAAFEKMDRNAGDNIHVAWTHGFVNYRNRSLLFETLIVEPTIEQHVAIMMLPRDEPQQYTLRYATMGHPRPTIGLHRATNLLGEWVVSLHPDAHIIERRLKVD